MKTHQLAAGLDKISAFLKSAPNVDLDMFLSNFGLIDIRQVTKRKNQKEDLPLALSALVSLARIDKQEWLALISDLGFAIDIRPRDASRDILGKVLRYLEDDADARFLLSSRVKNKQTQASPELARALSSLLSSS